MTKHSIGSSRPSRAIKVKCPPLPPAIGDVYQVDTDQLGVILLTWQVPTSQSVGIVTEEASNNNDTPVPEATSIGSNIF